MVKSYAGLMWYTTGIVESQWETSLDKTYFTVVKQIPIYFLGLWENSVYVRFFFFFFLNTG